MVGVNLALGQVFRFPTTDMLVAATGGGFGGWLARVARGAQYGAVRGQCAACYMETYGRGYFGRPSERGYSGIAPVDVQSFYNFVSRQPMAEDAEVGQAGAESRG